MKGFPKFTILAVSTALFIPLLMRGQHSQKNDVQKIVAYFYTQIIFSSNSMSCEEFETRPDVEHRVITDKKKIDRMVRELESGQKLDDHFNMVDTRGKLLIFYNSGEVDTVCLSLMKYVHYKNSMVLLKSDKLLNLVFRSQ